MYEEFISNTEAMISSPEISGDYQKLLEATEQLNAYREQLETLYEEWEALQTM